MIWMTLASRNFRETWRNPLSLGLGAAMPCAFIAIFAELGKRAPLEVFTLKSLTPSMAVFSFSFIIMFSAVLVSKDRASGLFRRLLATPLGRGDFIVAYALPFLPFALLQALSCYALGAALGSGGSPAGAAAGALALAPVALACAGLGIALGCLCTENQIAGVGSAAISAIGLLGGAWFDLESAGGAFAGVGLALPFYRASRAARALYLGAAPAAADLAVAWAWATGALALASASMGLRTRRT